METAKLIAIIIGCTIGGIIALELLYFSLVIISSLLINTKKIDDKDHKYFRFLINFTTALIIKMDRIHIHVKGIENVPKDKKFLLVSNHRSNWDPITTWYVLKKCDLSFITKPENLKIPFFGKIIQRCCFMPIDRNNPRLAIPTIERSIKLLKAQEVSVGVYPEGTRSKTLELLPFHAAVFKIATKAQVPLVVMSIYKTETIYKAFPFGRSDIYIDVLKVFSEEEVKNMRSVELCDTSYNLIKVKMDEYNSAENL